MEENTMQKTERTERQDVYTRITAQIVADRDATAIIQRSRMN
jgi:hypothetical protein